jgi:hypothetical protein
VIPEKLDRTLLLAQRLTGEAETALAQKFVRSHVLISGDDKYLQSANGRASFRASVNMVSRFCSRITVGVSDISLRRQAQGIFESIEASEFAQFRGVRTNSPEGFDAHLHIGPGRGLKATRIMNDNWTIYVSSVDAFSPPSALIDNPLGAVAAACFGVADVFKKLLGIDSKFGKQFENERFNMLTYEKETSLVRLPDNLDLPYTLVAGCGAVGNALAYALEELARTVKLAGAVVVCDKDVIHSHSLNRHLLAVNVDASAQTRKVLLMSRSFQRAGVTPLMYDGDLKDLVGSIRRGSIRTPQVVLSGLDNNEARHWLQSLWPDLLIEAATGETTVQVSRHEYDSGLACLMCIHPKAVAMRSYQSMITRLTGMSAARIDRVNETINARDVARAPEEMRDFLRVRIGQRICGVLSEVESIAVLTENVPLQPTVSFVSALAGCLLAAEYVLASAGIRSSLSTFFQADLLFPLGNSMLQGVLPENQCYCKLRRAEIQKYREEFAALRN